MGRLGVAYEEVAQAAQEAQGKGKSPTVDNVRLIIGSGSKSTIARHLRDWRNQQGIARGSDGAIPSELLGLVKGLWERLRDTVEQKAYDYQCESDARIKQIQLQLTQSQQQNAALQEQRHRLEEKSHQQTEIINQSQGTIVFEQQEKAKISERSISQESHRQEQQIELQIKLMTHEDKITSLEMALSKADDKIQILRDDFRFVSQEKAHLEGQFKHYEKGTAA